MREAADEGHNVPFLALQGRNEGASLPPVEDLGGGSVQGTITEAELRRRIEREGASVLDALVVVHDRPMQPRQFYLYLRPSWEPESYLAFARHRGQGLRDQKSLDPWLRLLDTLGYQGGVLVRRDGDPELANLRLVGMDTQAN